MRGFLSNTTKPPLSLEGGALLAEKGSRVAQAALRGDHEAFPKALRDLSEFVVALAYQTLQEPRVFSSIASLKFKNWADITFWKYPHVCPYCSSPVCRCSEAMRYSGEGKKDGEYYCRKWRTDPRLKVLRLFPRPRTQWGFQRMFRSIYPHNAQMTPNDISNHFLSEVTEFQRALQVLLGPTAPEDEAYKRGDHQLEVCLGIADIVAWYLAVKSNLSVPVFSQRLSLGSTGFPSIHRRITTWGNLV